MTNILKGSSLIIRKELGNRNYFDEDRQERWCDRVEIDTTRRYSRSTQTQILKRELTEPLRNSYVDSYLNSVSFAGMSWGEKFYSGNGESNVNAIGSNSDILALRKYDESMYWKKETKYKFNVDKDDYKDYDGGHANRYRYRWSEMFYPEDGGQPQMLKSHKLVVNSFLKDFKSKEFKVNAPSQAGEIKLVNVDFDLSADSRVLTINDNFDEGNELPDMASDSIMSVSGYLDHHRFIANHYRSPRIYFWPLFRDNRSL